MASNTEEREFDSSALLARFDRVLARLERNLDEMDRRLGGLVATRAAAPKVGGSMPEEPARGARARKRRART